jgi:hypothetical protein
LYKKYNPSNQSNGFIKKHWVAFIIIPFIFLLLLQGTLSASTSITKAMSTSGTISTQISTTNLAPMFQGGTCRWGQYDDCGFIAYGSTNPSNQIGFKDNSVLHNGHSSIRVEAPNSANLYREINFDWIAVKPGDHVVFRCWIKTASGTGNAAIIGFDVYGSSNRILEIHPCSPQSAIWNIVNDVPVQGGTPTYIPYGSDWTLLTFDVTIPSTHYTHDDFRNTIPSQQIAGFIPWVGGIWNGRSSYPNVWFADAELYINP